MTVEVKQLGDEPIVIATLFDPLDAIEDAKTNIEFTNAVAQQFNGTVYRITDFTNFEVTFSQLTVGLAEDIKLVEPNVRHLFVGTGQLVELQVEAGKQNQYGAHEIKLFGTLDEAIAFARQELQVYR